MRRLQQQHAVKTPPFFSAADMNITAMSKRLTLARLLRVSSRTAGSSLLQTATTVTLTVLQHDYNRTKTPPIRMSLTRFSCE